MGLGLQESVCNDTCWHRIFNNMHHQPKDPDKQILDCGASWDDGRSESVKG